MLSLANLKLVSLWNFYVYCRNRRAGEAWPRRRRVGYVRHIKVTERRAHFSSCETTSNADEVRPRKLGLTWDIHHPPATHFPHLSHLLIKLLPSSSVPFRSALLFTELPLLSSLINCRQGASTKPKECEQIADCELWEWEYE